MSSRIGNCGAEGGPPGGGNLLRLKTPPPEEGQAETKSLKIAFESLNPAVPEALLLDFSVTSVKKHLHLNFI